MAATCTKGSWNNNLYAIDEHKNDSNNEVHDTDGDVQTWCTLGEGAPEQWHEVVTKKTERKQQTLPQTSILSVETKQGSVPPRSLARSRTMGRKLN